MILVRELQNSDITTLAEIYVRSWQVTYANILPGSFLQNLTIEKTINEFNKVFYLKNTCVYVATIDNEVVGFVHVGPSREGDNNAEIYAIYIEPEKKGHGIGKALFVQSIKHSISLNANSLTLWTFQENSSCGFYTKMNGNICNKKTIKIAGTEKPAVKYIFKFE